MGFVTTRSRCAGDLRFVPSFEHHGRARNTFSSTGTGLGLTNLAAMPLGSTRVKLHLRNRRTPSPPCPCVGKGGLGAKAALSSCHVHAGDDSTETEPARTDIACPFERCFGARQRLVNSPRAILGSPMPYSDQSGCGRETIVLLTIGV